MSIDKKYIDYFVNVTSKAALSASYFVGKKDKIAADKAATDSMRSELNKIDMNGKIVIGEGELDEAPMLYIGEMLGTKKGPNLDIAVDPLEGTNFAANNLPGALSVIAISEKNHLFNAPETYMDKIAVGPKAAGVIDLDASPKDNINAVAKKLEKDVEEVTVIILDRDRHKNLIEDVRKTGARIRLILDGDVSGAISTAIEESGIDILMGIGAAPEGVIAASALKTFGGELQGRLKFRNDEERKRAKEMGFLKDLDKKLLMEDLVKGDQSMFSATGVTNGEMLKGVRFVSKGAVTNSLVTRSLTGTMRFIETHHIL